MYILTTLITVILILLVLLLILLFIFPIKAVFSFNSEQMPDYYLMATWLNPLLKGIVTNENGKRILTVYLFNMKIVTRDMKSKQDEKHKKGNKLEMLRAIDFKHVNMQTSYSFVDPSLTGIICGIADFISEYIELDSFSNIPSFDMESDYFNISISAEVYAIISLVRLIKLRQNFNSQAALAGK